MKLYTAKIQHSEDTIKAMAKTQYECFRSKSYYVTMLACVGALAVSLFVPNLPQGAKTLLIMLGCFGIVGLGSPPRQLAKQVINNLKGKFPKMEYSFGAKSVQLTGSDAPVLEYKEIFNLAYDSKYFYIFLENRSAYMLDRSSVRPDEKGFMKFVADKTGLEWSRPGTMAKLSSLRLERVKTRL